MQNLINREHSLPTQHCIAILFNFCLLLPVSTVRADTLRMADGQAYSQLQFEELTLDGGYRLASGAQRYGLKISLPVVADSFVPFAEINRAQTEVTGLAATSDVDFTYDRAWGAGFYFTDIPDWRNMSLALRLSRNDEEVESESNIVVSGFQASARVKRKAFSVSVLISPKAPLLDNGTNGYLSIGLTHNRSHTTVLVDDQPTPALSRKDENVDPYLAAGIVYPFGRFSLYGVIDYEQEVSLAVGLRLQVSRTAADR